jgi:hypothetical protein
VGKFLCVCGTSISTSGGIPNHNEWRFLSDDEFDQFHGQVDAGEVYRSTHIFYRCPVSGHLWVFWDGFDSEPTGYAPLPKGYPSRHGDL